MKRNNIHTFLAAALLLTACTQEELSQPGTSEATQLSFTISDNGYAQSASASGSQKAATRATENDYRTEFTSGDECGLYIVRGGTVVYDNVKLTATADADGSLTWQPESPVAGGVADESYYLYYPYQEDMTGKTDFTATTDDAFFATLAADWTPATDQSTYAAYTASDLMTAEGTASKDGTQLNLSFSMTHRMAMAVIEMPKTVYKFTNTAGTLPDCTTATPVDFTGSGVQPYCTTPGTYRCIVNLTGGTAASITGSYADGKREFTVTPSNIKASNYKVYNVDGASTVEKECNLQVGDFYCSKEINGVNTGYVVPQEAVADLSQHRCIGIVFYVGQHENDASDYSVPLYAGTAHQLQDNTVHGYVVALQDATSRYRTWGVYGDELGCCPKVEGQYQNNYSNPDIDWNGYAWTRTIISNGAGSVDKLNGTSQAGYPAAYFAVVDYGDKVSAPAGSSGWFLPSIGQMREIYRQHRNDLESDWYWSSSEYYRNPACCALAVSADYGDVHDYSKSSSYSCVRPVLAF